MGRLSTPTVSSVPGEYNYFSAGAKVIITAGASGYCKDEAPSSAQLIYIYNYCI